jgi:misacylated tRNA(Ala) deacylase
MTEALFRNDAYLKDCNATIVGHTEQGIILDRSVFYPEGGGQPGDRGVLTVSGMINGDEINVIDTRKLDNGAIEHVLHDPHRRNVLPVETRVNAAIDWPYRYRHMRMHTCLHLLCALIPFSVTGGSLNQDKGRLDFDMAEGVDKEELTTKLNALIEKHAPVEHQWISDEEMRENMALVRTMSVAPPMGQGKVRLVAVEEIDLQPCGGTHVANTAEIGKVRIGKVEKKGKHNRRINVHLEI